MQKGVEPERFASSPRANKRGMKRVATSGVALFSSSYDSPPVVGRGPLGIVPSSALRPLGTHVPRPPVGALPAPNQASGSPGRPYRGCGGRVVRTSGGPTKRKNCWSSPATSWPPRRHLDDVTHTPTHPHTHTHTHMLTQAPCTHTQKHTWTCIWHLNLLILLCYFIDQFHVTYIQGFCKWLL